MAYKNLIFNFVHGHEFPETHKDAALSVQEIAKYKEPCYWDEGEPITIEDKAWTNHSLLCQYFPEFNKLGNNPSEKFKALEKLAGGDTVAVVPSGEAEASVVEMSTTISPVVEKKKVTIVEHDLTDKGKKGKSGKKETKKREKREKEDAEDGEYVQPGTTRRKK